MFRQDFTCPALLKDIARFTPTRLSRPMAPLSRGFGLYRQYHWAGPRSLATTSGVSVDVLSSGYLDVSVPRVRLPHLWIQCGITLRWGFPIRKSADQSLLAAPHSLSQRATSFIASQCQGIHEMPLLRLIASYAGASPTQDTQIFSEFTRSHATLDPRKTSRRSAGACARSEKPIHDDKEQAPRTRGTAPFDHSRRQGNSPPNERFSSASGAGVHSVDLAYARISSRGLNGPTAGLVPRSARSPAPAKSWWSQSGSNRRPQACKASALPTELWPRLGIPLRTGPGLTPGTRSAATGALSAPQRSAAKPSGRRPRPAP